MTPTQFAKTLLAWFDNHGRKHLPWQQSPITSYRVWVSEIMLQQTQVATVIPYFQRFIARFPDVYQLAGAQEDEVLHLWSGLGYYSRARHLHRSAQLIVEHHRGELPRELTTLQSLPGIGRSTAGAILAIAGGQRTAILDGNVKRVLTRFHAIAGWPGRTDVTKKLWAIAERYTPKHRTAAYTQAIMDLGATVCTRTQPVCTRCPLVKHCQAYQTGQTTAFPTPKPAKDLPVRQVQFLLLCDIAQKRILLTKRPPTGVWGGLWSLPECGAHEEVATWCARHYYHIQDVQRWSAFRHTFSHFHLDITPVQVTVKPQAVGRVMDSTALVWYKIGEFPTGGLATPVKRLLHQLAQRQTSFLEPLGALSYHDSNDPMSKVKKTR